ncbi:MAG: hypothetical protein DRI46_14410 [Chloroflexi bacterium]|nr:MAG: hypothetical protein DRI46_14410 [Chloroflexota bacterium]
MVPNPSKFANGGKRLGSRSEVEGFRVEPGQWMLVVRLAVCEAAKLLDTVLEEVLGEERFDVSLRKV